MAPISLAPIRKPSKWQCANTITLLWTYWSRKKCAVILPSINCTLKGSERPPWNRWSSISGDSLDTRLLCSTKHQSFSHKWRRVPITADTVWRFQGLDVTHAKTLFNWHNINKRNVRIITINLETDSLRNICIYLFSRQNDLCKR